MTRQDDQGGAPAGNAVGDAARRESDAITTSDGAVRQLEKADRVAVRAQEGAPAKQAPDPQQDPDWNEVVPLGKAGGGAPEEAAADAEETGGAEVSGGR